VVTIYALAGMIHRINTIGVLEKVLYDADLEIAAAAAKSIVRAAESRGIPVKSMVRQRLRELSQGD
jgi:hypothetical protein